MTGLRMKAGFGLALVAASLAGCHHREPVPFPTYSFTIEAPAAAPTGGFARYVAASDDVESKEAKYIDRTTFTPGMKSAVIAGAAPDIATIASASSAPVEFAFAPHAPFSAEKHTQGWRLIGRALSWRIAQRCQTGDFDGAVADTILATKFGFDLCGGSGLDASLGFAIVGDARRALALYLMHLGAGQLGTLRAGLQSALSRKPPLKVTLEHEHSNMLAAVQAIQKAYQEHALPALQDNLGPDSRDAVEYLEKVGPEDAAAYFAGFAKEADDQAAEYENESTLPAAKRSGFQETAPPEKRPWRRFSRDFFSGGDTLLAMNDETLARTRLFALEAMLLQQAKASKSLPKDLSGAPKELNVDPYTGGSFLYRVDGMNFQIYSVGKDLTDDGGDTDSDYSRPDLTLERPRV